MDWDTFILFVLMNILPSQAYHNGGYMNELGDLMPPQAYHGGQYLNEYGNRLNFISFDGKQRMPRYPKDLPVQPKLIPGHTLLNPSRGMLKSAVKFPLRDVSNPVYGNLENLGITYGHGERIRYTDFRKANNLLSLIMDLTEDINKKQGNEENTDMIVIETNPLENENLQVKTGSSVNNIVQISEEENNAFEILDVMNEDLPEQSHEVNDFRRNSRRKRKKYRNRWNAYSTSDSSESSSGSSDFEKNPGNPYTIHKDKYIQNWMWKHDMDGDHMNLNPYAPDTYHMGPSGAELFFSRKWWYYNQDDYKPL